jgi:TonB family protein
MNCIRCKRGIDDWAVVCPFCNWDQSKTPPAREFVPEPVANYRPAEETSLRRRLLFGGGGVLLLIAAFFVGMVINSDGAPKNAPATLDEQAAAAVPTGTPRRAETPLIPTNERGGFEAPITSAPAAAAEDGTPNDYQRTDATAVSATEYAQMAKLAKAEKQRLAAAVDPRSITGSPYAEAPRRSAPPPQTSASTYSDGKPVRTRPVLEYRPLPPIEARGSARLTLLVGEDGHVRSVDVDKPVIGNNAQLVAAVHQWRFRPATRNGHAVASPFTVEISFRR